MSQRQDRADRLLIGVALVILFMAGAAYYFDNWMWGGKKVRGERIGAISSKNGDVRVKFEGDLKWANASRGQDLVYNDSIYAGGDSMAEIALGNSQMTVQENTLIVLRREKDVNFLNLDYGTLFAKVGKNEKIMIDSGQGKPIEFSATSNSQIVLRKIAGGKTELNVISGDTNVIINGKKKYLPTSAKLILDEPTAPAPVQATNIIAIKPLKSDVLYSNKAEDIPFQWEWNNKAAAQAQQNYALEFSAEPNFQKIHATKTVTGRLNTSMHASKSLSLYYRVRGPRGELSQVERVNFVRMMPPLILQPVAAQEIFTPTGKKATVQLEFRKDHGNVWYQVSNERDFNRVLVNQNTPEAKQTTELADGNYFIRARHDYGQNRLSDWSPAVPFKVTPKLDMLPLAQLPQMNRHLIPNKPYPADLYNKSAAKVRDYLAKNGFLKNYFPMKTGTFDTLKVAVEGQNETLTQTTPNWPKAVLAPGHYIYRYQATKAGFEPSAIAGPNKLDIAMEPPRPIGETTFAAALEDGSREAQWAFTPLLFARSYDVEVARDPSFRGSKQLKVDVPVALAQLNPGEHYWRARARDAQGRIISDFSSPSKISVPGLVPSSLAANDDDAGRKPAATDSSVMKIDDKPAEAWVRNGWWAWAGTGANYVDTRQSIPGRGTATSHGQYFGSRYFEGGYNGSSGWGGVFSYKSTPGKIETENAVINETAYTWSTVGIEAYRRSLTRLPFTNVPLVYGFRVGLQQHKTPFVFLDSDTNLILKENKMNMGSFGLIAEVQRRKWNFYFMTRYQYPFSSAAEGSSQFDVKPTFAFDGSIGTSYNLTDRLKLGLFWYGQWHQYNFVYGDGNVTNVGFQSLFYSNIDLRLGFDF